MCQIIDGQMKTPDTVEEILQYEYSGSIKNCEYLESKHRHAALDYEIEQQRTGEDRSRSITKATKTADLYKQAIQILQDNINKL